MTWLRSKAGWRRPLLIACVIPAACVATFPDWFTARMAWGFKLASWTPFTTASLLILIAAAWPLLRLGREPAAPGEDLGRFWWPSLAIGVLLYAVYSSQGRTYNLGDTIPAVYLPVAMIRGDGPYLDRFESDFHSPGGDLPYGVSMSRGHLVSRYPLGTPILAIPFVLPQLLARDWRLPGWEQIGDFEQMARRAAAAIGAMVGVALVHVLRRLGLARVAVPTTLAATLGSDLWNEGARALWQHDSAALMLTATILLLLPESRPRWRTCLAGLTTAMLPVCRPIDLLLAAAIALWMLRRRPRDLARFLPFPILVGAALVAYNLRFFGSIKGGYLELEGGQGLLDAWPTPLRVGMTGTLFSPSRGLFVFTPWVALALLTLPATSRRIAARPPVSWLLWALVPYLLLLSKTRSWFAGQSFGPRFWIDVVPLFAILLGFGLDWSRARCRPVFRAFVAAILASVLIQIVGAAGYPSTWGLGGFAGEKLWDWRDTELIRCWREASWLGSRGK